MLTAKNHKGNVCFADYASKDIDYTCPECGEEVILKVGEIKIAHFAHKHAGDCSLCGEGEEHLRIKKEMYDWLMKQGASAKLEHTVANQRADIFLQTESGDVAIEIQCSPISIDDMVERTQGWFHKNVCVMWILSYNSLMERVKTTYNNGKPLDIGKIRKYENWIAQKFGFLQLWKDNKIVCCDLKLYTSPTTGERCVDVKHIDWFFESSNVDDIIARRGKAYVYDADCFNYHFFGKEYPETARVRSEVANA